MTDGGGYAILMLVSSRRRAAPAGTKGVIPCPSLCLPAPPSFTDSVIRRMTRVSLKYGAVNLSQGFPDFDPPQAILDRLAQVAREGPHQYSVTWGAQNFREALARKQSRYMGRTIDPDREIVATCGSTEAMMCAMMTVADPGDKVIVFSPFYENYGADTILSGAEPIYVPLHPARLHLRRGRAGGRLPPASPRRWSCATPPTPAAGSSPGRSC